MNPEEFALATQWATNMCDCASRRAAELGFLDGMITTVLHRGDVVRAHMELFDAQGSHAHLSQLAAPRRPVGPAQMQDLFRATMREGLAHCIVRYGDVKTFFSKGVLYKVSVTETFRIEEEIPELGRVFLLSLSHPLDGHRQRRTPSGGNGSQT